VIADSLNHEVNSDADDSNTISVLIDLGVFEWLALIAHCRSEEGVASAWAGYAL